MDYQEDPLVEINVVFLFATDEAIKVEDCDSRQVWIPISTLGHDANEIGEWDNGVELTLSLRESMARNKGLI